MTKLGEIFPPKDLLVILALAIIMAIGDYAGLLAGFEGWLEDRYLIFAGSSRPPVSSSVVVLDIDEPTHEACFDARPPMNPRSIWSLLTQIDRLGAAVIGVDVLTDPYPNDPTDPNYKEKLEYPVIYRQLAQGELPKFKTRIVWAAGVADGKFRTDVPHIFAWFAGKTEETVIKPTGVLGLDPGELDGQREIAWGPAVYTPEGDRKLRRFPRDIWLSADPTSDLGILTCSWARIVGDSYAGKRPPCDPGNEREEDKRSEVFLPIGSEPEMLSVHEFFTCDPRPGFRAFRFQDGKENLLKLKTSGKIVLLGGTFASSGDFHQTPNGLDPGILVNARAVEAEIGSAGLEEVKPYRSFGLDLVTGLMMLLGFFVIEEIFKQNRVLVTIAGSLAAVGLLWLAVYVSIGKHYVFSFATLILGVLIHQLIDLWKKRAAPAHEAPAHKPTRKPGNLRRGAHRG